MIVVVPCYNEAERLPTDVFSSFLDKVPQVGFVFVNDGSRDRTPELLAELAASHPSRIAAIDLERNRGKGEAVRRGLLLAMDHAPAIVGFWDADLSTPLEAIPQLAQVMIEHSEIEMVLGARVGLLGHDIRRRVPRHYAGRIFATAASLVLGIPVYDTQCGAKLMRNTERLREVLREPFGSRWIFDVEMIARFRQAGGKARSIYEFPLDRWHDIGHSKVRPGDYLRAIFELSAIHRRYRVTPGSSTRGDGRDPQ
ncbi:MAG: glycosyltransferase [Myxococcales bacterium]|nr:glycosyltransferase [Myxococcales bacterium]MDD9965885.1 glycosyltransferase [Myxococcales bacterium]